MTGDGAEEYLTRAVVVPLGPTPAHERLPPKQGTRKGRPVGFPRCKSRDRSKSSVTFVESTRRLSKKVAAGEAAIQKVTISHVGGRWQESALERYLIRYHIGQCFHQWFRQWCLLQHQARPGQARAQAVQPIPPTQDVAGLRPETKNADLRPEKTGVGSPGRAQPIPARRSASAPRSQQGVRGGQGRDQRKGVVEHGIGVLGG